MNFQEMYKKYAEAQVRSSHKKYKNIYQSLSYDFDDLKQEILVLLWELEKDIKSGRIVIEDDQPLENYVRKSVQHKLLRILLTKGERLFSEAEKIDLVIPFQNETDYQGYELLYSNLFLELISEALTDKEYAIIFRRFVNNEEFVKIGKDLKLSKQRVYQIYEKILKKLKFYLTKDKIPAIVGCRP